MGWTYQEKPFGQTPRQIMDAKYSWESETASNKVIASAMVGWGEYYAAVETTIKASGEKYVWAGIALVHNVPKAKDGYTFGYKDMDETVGPNSVRMPKSIFDKLTPLEQSAKLYKGSTEYAVSWRAKVAAHHAKPKPKKGQIVSFAAPVSFGSYGQYRNFLYVSGSVFNANGMNFRIVGWRDKDFTVKGVPL